MSSKIPNQTAAAIFRNIVYGFSTWILPLLISFIATPIIIKKIGNTDYGIYLLILGLTGSFNFNLGRAVTKYIAEYRASGEFEKLLDIVSTAYFSSFVIGVFGVACIFFGADWLVASVFKIEEVDQSKSVTALHAASFIIFFASLSQISMAILQGIHRFDVYSKILNVFNFALLIGNLVLVVCGQGLLELLYWNLAVSILSCVVFSIGAKKLLPEFRFIFKFKSEILKLIVYFSAAIIGYQVLTNSLLLFERGWIIRHLGTENLTFYVVPLTLAVCLHSFVASLVLVIFPLASELKDDKEKLLRLYLKATRIVCFFVFFFAAALIVESDVFLTLWMGQAFAEKTTNLLIIHTVTFGFLAISTVSWQMIEGLGFPGFNFLVCGIGLILNVIAVLLLTESFGNNGIAVGKLIGYGAFFPLIFYVEKWIFERVQTKFWLKLLFGLTTAAIVAGAVIKFIIVVFPVKWLTLSAATLGGGICYLSVVWLLNIITDEEKKMIRKFLSNRTIVN